jgi:hypothetical protein
VAFQGEADRRRGARAKVDHSDLRALLFAQVLPAQDMLKPYGLRGARSDSTRQRQRASLTFAFGTVLPPI